MEADNVFDVSLSINEIKKLENDMISRFNITSYIHDLLLLFSYKTLIFCIIIVIVCVYVYRKYKQVCCDQFKSRKPKHTTSNRSNSYINCKEIELHPKHERGTDSVDITFKPKSSSTPLNDINKIERNPNIINFIFFYFFFSYN